SSVLSIILLSVSDATAPPESSTPSLHDALPISPGEVSDLSDAQRIAVEFMADEGIDPEVMAAMIGLGIGVPGATGLIIAAITSGDRKSTRLNCSHVKRSYPVFCLKKKKIKQNKL